MARGEEQIGVTAELEVGEVAAALLEQSATGILFLARDEIRARAVAQAADAVSGDRLVLYLPANDSLPGDRAPASPEIAGQRTSALRRLRDRVGAGQPVLLVSSGEAAGRLLPHPTAFDARPPRLATGDPLDLEQFRQAVLDLGYVEDDRVDEPGEVAVRGSVVDIFPGDSSLPVRIEVAEGRIVALRAYDPLTQLTEEDLARIELGTVHEPDCTKGVTLVEHLPGAALALDPGAEARRRRFLALAADAARRRPARALADICPDDRWVEATRELPRLNLASGSAAPPPRFIEKKAPDRAFRRFANAALNEGKRLVLLGSERDLRFLLRRVGRAFGREVERVSSWADVVAAPPASLLALAMPAARGFSRADVTAIAAADLIGSRAEQESSGPGDSSAAAAFAIGEIRPGDLVIHEDHGLAAVAGLADLPDQAGEAIVLRFAGESRRLVPVAEAGRLWRYGGEEQAVALDRLDGSSWLKRRGEIVAAVAETARALIRIADERASAKAPPLEPDATRYEQLVGSFPYSETGDQLKAVAAIRADLASGRPMDRLLIGDVGFGKTEVALRAAAMAVFAGRQVAIAAPTTVLARQHLEVFRERFAEFGIEVAMLSRLITPAERKRILAGLAEGDITIVVGTGAIAGKGVTYRDLGLVVVDEEQRFGAKDKEKLRSLGAPHALSVTATPIPRTLQSALVGLQPMSLLTTPPARRQPIRTEIGPFDAARLRTALLRERSRAGQSFVVVPRIEDMAPLASSLNELVPELAIVSAHGKLPAGELDETMVGFAGGEGDVLLATNIIEAGLDVPRANTMVVVHAERFGLAQLHQLRGRVGRGARRGHILLMTSADRPIPKATLARLQTLATFDRLGAGFAISARDLDLRGAGDLLGEEQSGHLKLIGIDLYQHLLEAALREARGQPGEDWSPELRLGPAGRLPADWIPEEEIRLSLYFRLARMTDIAALERFAAELADRFGETPPEAELLLAQARIRLLARSAGIAKVEAGPAAIALTPRDPNVPVPQNVDLRNGRWILACDDPGPEQIVATIEDFLAELSDE